MARFNKRLFDITLSVVLIPFALPIIIISALLIFVELKEYPFFVQERGLTLSKYRFNLYKIKTLKNCELDKIYLPVNKMILSKIGLTPYVHKFAGFLRCTGMDELPQLFNILKGEMSFIGPRPLMIDDLIRLEQEYPDFYLKREKLTSKPGLSGLWQIFCNREKDVSNLIELDVVYEKLGSFMFDLKLLLLTIPLVLTGSNSDSILYTKYYRSKIIFGLCNKGSHLARSVN